MKKIRFLLLMFLALIAQLLQAQPPCQLDVEINPSAATLTCQNPTVQLQTTVSPPGNYDVFWSGPVQLPNVLNPVITQAGVYSVFVFDSLQCWGGDTIVITQDGSIPQVTITPTSTCDETTLTAVSTGGGPFQYAWSTGENTQSIEVPPSTPGTVTTWCVTVTNLSTGCSGAACSSLTAPQPLSATIQYFDTPFCNDSLGMWVNVQGGLAPFSYLWNNGSTSPWIPDPVAGTFSLTVTDSRGCTVVAATVIEENPDECANLEGYVRVDWNSNCALDAGDNGLANIVLRIADGAGNESFAYTDASGFYRTELYPGTYEVTVEPINSLWQPCQATYTVTIGANQTLVQDFLIKPLAICPAMTVDINSTILRRCFSGQYSVFYCNQGTADATGAYVEIDLDDFLTLSGASIPFTNLGNNRYRFDLGNVAFNTCGSFWLNVLVSCDAVLGQTHCTEALIFPPGDCIPTNPQWSGASLDVGAACETDSIEFTIRNAGVGPMNEPLEYVVIEDAVMLMQAPPPSILLGSGEEYKFKVPANGATWRVEVEQAAFHPGNSQPSLSVEGCANNVPFTTGFVTQFPLNDNDPWVDIDCDENVGSYDPNDKQGMPRGYDAAHYIEQNTDIEYTIRFQNTGTDTAFTVVIRDELSPWLDAATIRPGAASHPYSFDFYDERSIKFTFENINLPDSNVNLAGSQGFVSFRISQKTDVPLQTDILNAAGIYFDFNAPVITNQTRHRVGQDFVTVGAWQPFSLGLDLRVMPNPVTETAIFQLDGLRPDTEWQAELSDASGRPIRKATVNGNRWTFERGTLPSGMYFLRIVAGGQVLGTGKVVLE